MYKQSLEVGSLTTTVQPSGETPDRDHWLVEAAQSAGLTGTEALELAPTCPVSQAWEHVCRNYDVDDDELLGHLAARLRLGVANLDSLEATALKLVPSNLAHLYQAVPIRQDDRRLVVATADPTAPNLESDLYFVSGRRPVLEVASPAAIERAVATYYPIDATGPCEVPSDSGPPPGPIEVARGPAPASMPAGGSQDTHVLVVDDEEVDRISARSILEGEGFQVSEATGGTEALALLARPADYNLLLLDLDMPVVGGREVLASVRGSDSTANLPVLVLTGFESREMEAELFEKGADDYILKPVVPPRLLARITAALLRRTRR